MSDKETKFNAPNVTFLDLRKLFNKRVKEDNKKGYKINLTGKLGSSKLLPLNSLMASLTIFYSIDYIRKILKKKYLSNSYTVQHYNINLFPNFLHELSKTIFLMNKDGINSDQIEKNYLLLLKYEPSLSIYSYQNFHVI